MKAAFTPGTTFAGYRVEALVGRCGMGVVYRATDLSLERPVALKLIAPELADDERFRSRFLREPRLAASLDHPNVIPIYDAGEHDGQLYLAMRFVDGSDLRTLLDTEGKLPPERTVEILAQVAGALDSAHRRALVHRDVKPGNVLLDRDGHVYLTDFGITQQLGGAPTDTGRMVGTLDYLAPEQIRGDPVDARTDGYALGCVLYECLAGRAPFHRETEAETMWAHMQEQPAPLRGQGRLDPVLRKALAKDREDRYGSSAELIEAAAAALGVAAPHTAARAARRRARRPGVLLVAGGLLLLVAAGGAAIAALGGKEDEEPAPQRNGVAAIDGGGTQLASFTQTESPPSSLAVGEGAVWVLGLEDSTLSRIDPETKELVKRFRLRHAPTDIAAGAGAVWVKGDGRLARIDPDTGKATRTVSSPPRSRTAISRSRTGAFRRLPSARAPSGRSTTTGRSPGSIPTVGGGWRGSSSTPPLSRPAGRASGSSAATTPVRSRASTQGRTGFGRRFRSEPRTSRGSLSGAAMCGRPRRGTASYGGSTQDARRSSGRLRPASA